MSKIIEESARVWNILEWQQDERWHHTPEASAQLLPRSIGGQVRCQVANIEHQSNEPC